MNNFKHEFLYTTYADDTTFFLKDRNSIIELMSELNTFSKFSGLKSNKTKCEIAGIGVLNGVQVPLCGMKCIKIHKNFIWQGKKAKIKHSTLFNGYEMGNIKKILTQVIR